MWKWLIIVALLLLLGLAVLSILHQEKLSNNATAPSELQGKITLTIDQPQTRDEAPSSPEKLKWFYALISWPNGITAVAVILTLGGILWQSSETRATARAAEAALALSQDTVKSQLRAYFSTPEGKIHISDDGSIVARLKFTNCGQTPAYDFQIMTCGRLEDPCREYPRPEEDPSLPPHPHIVGARSPYYFTCKGVASGREGQGISETILAELAGGILAFKVYGKCNYKDAFGDSHFLDFQLFIGAGGPVQEANEPPPGWWAMLTDKEGNDGD